MSDTCKYKTVLPVCILLGIMSISCVLSMRLKSPTVDEFAHLPAGYYYWKTGDFSLYGKNPPLIRLLCALPLLSMDISIDTNASEAGAGDWRPWVFGTHFMRKNAAAYSRIFFAGRIPVVILALILGIYVFRWARELYGLRGGLLSLLLYSFSPNILAHSRLATTDMGCTCFMFIAVYYYWRSIRNNGRWAWIGAGICLGLALLSKFTALLLLPIFLLLLPLSSRSKSKFWKPLKAGTLRLLEIIVVAVFILNLGYGFQESFKTLRSIPHESQFFSKLNRFPFNAVPLPIPAAYLSGFDRQKLDSERGVFLNYLRGRLSNTGWWYYFIYAFVVKTPIPLHIGIIICIIYAFWRRDRERDRSFLIIPVLVIIVVFSFLNNINVGLRYILPVFPFLFVWLGRLAQLRLRQALLRWATGVLIVAYVTSSVSIFPDYLAYFNVLAGGPDRGCHHLLDSNLDWGQDLKRLKGYMEENKIKEVGLAYFGHVDPAIYGIPYHLIGPHAESGYVAVSANYLYGLPYVITYTTPPMSIRPGIYTWLRSFRPKANIGHTIYIYELKASSLQLPGK